MTTTATGHMTLDELRSLANRLCKHHWGVEFDGEIELVATDWKSMNGCYMYYPDTGRHVIRMSSSVNASRTRKEVTATLLHELVHWRLRVLGKPNDDTDVGFVEECMRVGATISGTKEAGMAARKLAEKILNSKISRGSKSAGVFTG